MKKILTIAATAGLLAVLSSSAQAADVLTGTVNMTGAVTPSCTISTTTDGTLIEDTIPATKLTTNDPGTATVTCNSAASTLAIAVNAGTSVLHNGTAATLFGPAGTGIYSGASGQSVTATSVTAVGGDTARVRANVTAPAGKLLEVGNDYKVVVDLTLTP